VDFSSWARPASAARLGGVGPPQDPLASWFGRVQVALPGEDWPTTNGAPTLALAQLNLRELPCPPPEAHPPARTLDIIDIRIGVADRARNQGFWHLVSPGVRRPDMPNSTS
jgi:hypothetical protein